ncbi:hypothetical protein H4J59_03030 [Colwellia sp. MB02u-10]|uniref:hypothetical protein n=1 Tax=Colwellia sp. MB02u-10 TaxID=2759828 RepID=UPI0015F49DDE|nr:hypothetical protein [Colwellia sp. MB02u-10]MBA6339976.1 hypothetical protein [Colwellia sp. MB02u-10]
MINSINSNMSIPAQPRTDKNLTEDQQLLISETLSELDAESLNEEDAQSIIAAFSEAGVQPGAALEKAMSDFGFDAKTVGELANVADKGSMPPPPPKQSTEEISSIVDYLTELLDEKLATSSESVLSDEDKQSILTQVFEKFGMDDDESIINTSA